VPETHPTVREINSNQLVSQRQCGSTMLSVNPLHLFEHLCPIQEPRDKW